MNVDITREEKATILAALEYYKQEGFGDSDKRPYDIWEISVDGDGANMTSLSDEGIDELTTKLTTERIEMPHLKILHGQCPVCKHYGDDCTGDTEELGRHLYQHIERGAKTFGTFNPDIISLFVEQLTGEEYEKVHGFLAYLHKTGKTIGHGNYEQVYSEYLEAK